MLESHKIAEKFMFNEDYLESSQTDKLTDFY